MVEWGVDSYLLCLLAQTSIFAQFNVLDELICKLPDAYCRRWGQHIADKELDDLTQNEFAMWID